MERRRTMRPERDRHYHEFRHRKTGTVYQWVDLSTVYTGFVLVCTEAQSIFLVRFSNLERVE